MNNLAWRNKTPSLLTIAGTDPCSGAGVSADLAVMRSWGYHGISVVTAVVAQNTMGIRSVLSVPAPHVAAQLEALLEDITPAGIKIGMLGSAEVVAVVAARLDGIAAPVVLDPVLAGGQDSASLGGAAVAEAILERLLARVTLVTPNAPEATALTGLMIGGPEEQRAAAVALVEAGARAALVKGGHVPGLRGDVLAFRDGAEVTTVWFEVERVYPYATRGTGCHLASAACAGLAAGLGVVEAVTSARRYLDRLWGERAEALGAGARVFVHVATGGEPWR